MTSSSLYLAASGNYAESSSAFLPAINSGSASVCGFVSLNNGGIYTYVSGVGKYPSMDVTVGSTTAHVYFNYTGSNGYSVTIPSVAASTWYFFAVTATAGGSVYFYWGPVGTTPIRYLVTTSSGSSGGADNVMFQQATAGSSYACSFRYYTTAAALTQAQVNQESASLEPVNLPKYCFFDAESTTITGLLTNTAGGSPVLNSAGGSQYCQNSPTTKGALYLPAAGDYVQSTNFLPALNSGASASVCGFVYASSGQMFTYVSTVGKYPSLDFTVGTTTFNVYVNYGHAYSPPSPPPTVAANTWYFFAITCVVGQAPFLYWGLAGSTPTQYTLAGGTEAGTPSADYVTVRNNTGGVMYASSFRYFTTVSLSSSAVNQEAASLVPINNPTYHFLDPRSTSLGNLLSDSMGSGETISSNNNCVYSENTPLNKGIAPNNGFFMMMMSRIK